MTLLSPISLSIIAGICGLLIGSFLNVVIYRVPRKESLSHPGSHCPNCNELIKPYDNIPVISWLILRGSCRKCKSDISLRYPLIEITNAALFAFCGYEVRPYIAIPAVCIALAGLLACSVVDLDLMKIPTKIVYSTSLLGIPFLILSSFQTGQWWRLGTSLAGALGAGLVFFIIFFLAPPGGFGLGDVRLVTMEGLFLGWFGWKLVIGAIFLGIALGAIIAIVLLALGIKKMKDSIPFGPFLALGAATMLLFERFLGPHWTSFH